MRSSRKDLVLSAIGDIRESMSTSRRGRPSYVNLNLAQKNHGHAQQELSAALPYVPASLLARSLPALGELQGGARSAIASERGAALFVDVAGFSQLARSLARSDAAHGAEKLTSQLNLFLQQLISRLHARGAEVLLFLGDALVAFVPAAAAGGAAALRDAARLAVEAALDVRGIAFERAGVALRSHTGCGAGELQTYLVAAAQRASKDEEIVVSAEMYALLEGYDAEPVPPVAGRSLYRLSIPHGKPESCPRCRSPPRRTPLPAAAPAPRPGAGRGGRGASFFGDDIRRIVVLFASFPELDLAVAAGEGKHSGRSARHAARFAQVVRSVHRATAEYEGSVNKIVITIPRPLLHYRRQGASALLAFGINQHSHEDDDERAVRLALALQEWFAASSAPFACGVAAGRSFCGSLGAPCRKEYAVIGDCVIIAARLMSAAREAVAAERGPGPAAAQQRVFCDASVVASIKDRGRPSGLSFAGLPPVLAKGFQDPLHAYSPSRSDPHPAHNAERPLVTYRPPRGTVADPDGPEAIGGLGLLGAASDDPVTPSGNGGRRAPHACVGRGEELGRALAAVDRLCAEGEGGTVVIEGPAGYGKSRLLQEVTRECAARGVRVLRADATAVEESTPLWGLRGLLASVADVSSGEALRRDLAGRGLASAADAKLFWDCLFGAFESEAAPAADDEAARGQDSFRGRHSRNAMSFYGGAASLSGGKAASGRGLLPLFGAGPIARVSNAFSRLVLALEQDGFFPVAGSAAGPAALAAPAPAPAPAPAKRVAIVLEDAHWLDSASWFVIRCVRDTVRSALLVIASRPMPPATVPRDYLILSGQLDDTAVHLAGGGGGEEGPRPPLPARGGDLGDASPHSQKRGGEGVGGEGEPPVRMKAAAGGLAALADPDSKSDRRNVNGSGTGAEASPKLNTTRTPSEAGTPKREPLFRDGMLPPLRHPVQVSLIRLGPLPPDAARALFLSLAERMSVQLPPAAAESVLAKAAGVPLFLVELCRHSLAGPAAPDFVVPDSIQQIVLARTDRLPARAQAVLKVAATLGSGFTAESVWAVAGGASSPERVRRAFRTLRAANLILEREGGPAPPKEIEDLDEGDEDEDDEEDGGQPAADWPPLDLPFSFFHALTRDAVYNAMLRTQRRELHAAAGRWLEARSKDDGHDLAALAMHYRLGGMPEKALGYLVRAAEHAMATNALAEAARLNAEVVEAIDGLGLAGPDAPPVPRAARAEAEAPAGRRPSEVDPSATPGGPSKQAAWAVVRGCALRSWARVRYYEGKYHIAQELAAASLGTLGEPLAQNTGSPLALARALFRVWRLGRASDAAPPAAAAADLLASPTLLARRLAILDCSLIVMWSLSRIGATPARSKEHLARLIVPISRAYEISLGTPAEALALADVRVRGNFTVVLDAITGNQKRAQALLEGVEELAERLGGGIPSSSAAHQRGMQLCREGRFVEGVEAWARTVRLGGDHPDNLNNRSSFAIALFLTGNLAASERVCEEAANMNSRLGLSETFVATCTAVKCMAALLQGHHDRADALFQRSRASFSEERIGRSWYMQTTGLAGAVLAWRAGDALSALRFFEGAAASLAIEMQALLWHRIQAAEAAARVAREAGLRAPLAAGAGGGGGPASASFVSLWV
eukprot:tig00020849_g14668.t1